MKLFLCLFVVAVVFHGNAYGQIPGLAAQKNWDLSGYLSYMGSVKIAEHNNQALDHLLTQRVNYEYRFTPHFHFNSALRNRLFAGDSAEQLGFGEQVAADAGYRDLSANPIDKKGFIVNSQLDRLYLDWSNEDWQLRGGRFRINWAMSSLWNPNDIFNAYSLYDINYLERAGSDAIALQRKLGFASSIEAVYSPNRNSELNRYAGRYLFNQHGWDWQLLAGKADRDYLIGGGFAGALKGAGVRGEVTYFKAMQTQWQQQAQHSSLVASIESDYSFAGNGNWIARIALLYLSNAQASTTTQGFLSLPLSARTLSFSEFSYYADIGFDLSALSRLTLSTTFYSDGSLFLGVSNSYSLADNWQLQANLQGFTGREQSLFGENPYLLASAQLKWSF